MPNFVLDPQYWVDSSGQDPSVRWMRASDLHRVVQIERRCYPTPWTEASFRFEIERQAHAIPLVLTVEAVVHAYCCAWFIADELQINNVAVDPDSYRRGYATILLTTLLKRIRAVGGTRATLEVRESNAAARKLYERLGFQKHDRRSGFYSRPPESAVMLECILDKLP